MVCKFQALTYWIKFHTRTVQCFATFATRAAASTCGIAAWVSSRMDRIKRTSVDIKNFKNLDLVGPNTEQNLDLQLQTIQRLEHVVQSLQHIIKLLSETSLGYETQRYEEPLNNLLAVHNVLRRQYPGLPFKHAELLAECVNRMTQYTTLAPLTFFREKSGQAVHALQTIDSRRKILGFAKTLKDRSETILEIAGVPLP